MSFLSITDKINETKTIQIEWEGETISAEVYLNAVTKRFLKEIQFNEDATEKLIAKVYKSADVSLDGKTLVEINPDTLQDFPVSLLTAMSESVMNARETAKK